MYEAVGSQFVQRTPPVAFVSATRLPVAGNSPEDSTGTASEIAGMTPFSASTPDAAGSARTVSEMGPMGSIRGVTVISADGRNT